MTGTRGGGIPKNHPHNQNRKNHLTSNRQSPIHRPINIAHPIIKPIRNHNANTHEERLAAHVFPAFARLTQFRLVHGYGGGFDAGSEAGYEARDEELGA